MADNPYAKFRAEELVLRDQLAIDRTELANERTLLAYVRTALTLVIAGLTFLHFIQTGFLRVVGLVSVPIGILTGLYGVFRFARMRTNLNAAKGRSATE